MDPYSARCLRLLRSGKPVIVFDLETTGLFPDHRNPNRPRPQAWELGAIRRTKANGIAERKESRLLINVGRLPDDLVAWNRSQGRTLDPDLPIREGRDARAAMGMVVRAFTGAVLVGHNIAGFDGRVLAGDLRAVGMPVPQELSDPALQVDTLVWAQTLYPRGTAGAPENHKLETMAKFVGYDTADTAFHSAMDDCRATERILEFLYAEAVRRETAERAA